jgi:hypothetical protein
MRFTVRQKPFKNPYLLKAINPYSEHDGTNLQLGGSSGETAAR